MPIIATNKSLAPSRVGGLKQFFLVFSFLSTILQFYTLPQRGWPHWRATVNLLGTFIISLFIQLFSPALGEQAKHAEPKVVLFCFYYCYLKGSCKQEVHYK